MHNGSDTDRAAAMLAALCATDEGRSSLADPQVTEARSRPGIDLAGMLDVIMDGYATRTAFGERATELRTDPAGGRSLRVRVARFRTVTYGELQSRIRAVAGFWQQFDREPDAADDFVGLLGFASIDYMTAMLATLYSRKVLMPLQANGQPKQLRTILTETRPRWLFAGKEQLDAAADVIIEGHVPQRLILLDHFSDDDNDRAALAAARQRLAAAGLPDVVLTLDEAMALGRDVPLALPPASRDPGKRLAMISHTSGSTGSPKGVMQSEERLKTALKARSDGPLIVLHYLPMNHGFGQTGVYRSLGNGGACYFTRHDLSEFFEDMRLVRPTTVSLIPRLCEILHSRFQLEYGRRAANGEDRAELRDEILRRIREEDLGGRLLRATFGSAPLPTPLKLFTEELLGIPLNETFGSSEASGILMNGKVLRPPILDYRLADVPELGYHTTDKPHPRGELCVRSASMMLGYYNQPALTAAAFDADGYYRTGDIMAEVEPDRLVYLDRRNNILKLAQAEFVAVERLEGLFSGGSPLISQIYLYGTSLRSFLLAVVVPDAAMAAQADLDRDAKQLRAALSGALREVAGREGLQPYEVPQDFLIEQEPFSSTNGLLTHTGKLARAELLARYESALEQLYDRIAARQTGEIDRLRASGNAGPVIDTLCAAAKATLGIEEVDLGQDPSFPELGGDSLSALHFSLLLEEIFGVAVPVSLITGPAGTLRRLAAYVESAGDRRDRPTFASVHGEGSPTIRSADLSLEKFLERDVIDAAVAVLPVTADLRTVFITGATGFLGRFLCLEWLERMGRCGGKVIALVRGRDQADCERRLAKAFDSGDPDLSRRFTELAADHLEVLSGDLAAFQMGLAPEAWQRLAASVDLIVHPAALVNHVLPYPQLFEANVVGTAEIVRLAITTRLKRVCNISSVAVAFLEDRSRPIAETVDVREAYPVLTLDGPGKATGYGMSKWAGEVLLRNAHDRFGLPVANFRCDMILAHRRYAGQLNLPDLFSRLILSIAVTGLAPASFYRGGAERAHYDGLPVDFIAATLADLAGSEMAGWETCHVVNPHDDGISLDSFVDWIVADGRFPVARIADYTDWLGRFTGALEALPPEIRQKTSLPLLHNLQQPVTTIAGAAVPSTQFAAALARRSGTASEPIPHLASALIGKYLDDLVSLDLLSGGTSP
ncbi:MAG TPA: carboxylic acid reductase [Novosphingobium sp.]|nr:carboxylic acid reductase [Novosphingobium sp.]